MRVATSKYALEIHSSIDQAYEKLRTHCANVRDANILVLPEYAGMEWVWPYGKSFHKNVEIFQTAGLEPYKSALIELAKINDMVIIGGSVPVYDSQYYNRCYIAYPSGKLAWQDKIYLTPTEKALGWLKGSNILKIFNSDFGNFSVCICYDSEFPELTSQAVFAGVDALFVPSYTDSVYGAQRIRIAARACSMENQCFTITATCTGKVACDEFDGMATGDAGIFAPIDIGFPENGILQETNDASIVVATLDMKLISQVRSSGQVRNFHDRTNLKPITLQKEIL